MSKIDLIIDALERTHKNVFVMQALSAARELKAELAKPEQEPMRWFQQFGDAPPRKEWVGLTDKEIEGILDCGRGNLVDIKKAEQTLKDKNT